MIRVTVERSSVDHRIVGFTVKGHAGFADLGKDIVCAGVSAVTVGTINAVESKLNVRLEHSMKHGLLQVAVPSSAEHNLDKGLQLLLESMVVMLESIKLSYGKYITIQEKMK